MTTTGTSRDEPCIEDVAGLYQRMSDLSKEVKNSINLFEIVMKQSYDEKKDLIKSLMKQLNDGQKEMTESLSKYTTNFTNQTEIVMKQLNEIQKDLSLHHLMKQVKDDQKDLADRIGDLPCHIYKPPAEFGDPCDSD